jgi:8-oxo-dGTP pyrophosphatase MutT (NUDIX family)
MAGKRTKFVSHVIPTDRQGRVLLQKRPNGQWSFFGGHIDKGEKPKKAGKREFREETGRKAPKLKKLGTVGKATFYTYASPASFKVPPSSETKKAKWVKPSEIGDMKITNRTKKYLPHIQKWLGKGKAKAEVIASAPDIMQALVNRQKRKPKDIVDWWDNAAKDPSKHGQFLRKLFRETLTPEDFDGMDRLSFYEFRRAMLQQMKKDSDFVDWMDRQYIVKAGARDKLYWVVMVKGKKATAKGFKHKDNASMYRGELAGYGGPDRILMTNRKVDEATLRENLKPQKLKVTVISSALENRALKGKIAAQLEDMGFSVGLTDSTSIIVFTDKPVPDAKSKKVFPGTKQPYSTSWGVAGAKKWLQQATTSDFHKIVGCLVEAGETELAETLASNFRQPNDGEFLVWFPKKTQRYEGTVRAKSYPQALATLIVGDGDKFWTRYPTVTFNGSLYHRHQGRLLYTAIIRSKDWNGVG